MIEINARGARTLADAKPLTYDGQNVYVTTEGETAQLHLAGRIVAERPASEITCILDAQNWAYEIIETADEIAAAAPAADVAEVIAATDPSAVYDAAAAEVRNSAWALLDKAAEADKLGAEPHTYRNSRGRTVTIQATDPRHPARAAAAYRRDAIVLGDWTGADEAAYSRYISDGLSDTDGWFFPQDRAAWSHVR